MIVESLAASTVGADGHAASPLTWAAIWQRTTLSIAMGASAFVLAFLVIGVVALVRARVQDIPETVRALAQLLPFGHPAAPPSDSSNDECDPIQ